MQEKEFESEIRIIINDIDSFLSILNSLNAQIIKNYSFKDFFYKPKGVKNWDLEKKIMRIREWDTKSQILFTKTRIIQIKDFTFKQSIFPKGKLILFEGTLREAQTLLLDWNFEFWFNIDKEEGNLYNIKEPFDLTIALEKIKNFGYTAEIEIWGKNIDIVYDKFQKTIELLDLNRMSVTYKSLPKLVYEKLFK